MDGAARFRAPQGLDAALLPAQSTLSPMYGQIVFRRSGLGASCARVLPCLSMNHDRSVSAWPSAEGTLRARPEWRKPRHWRQVYAWRAAGPGVGGWRKPLEGAGECRQRATGACRLSWSLSWSHRQMLPFWAFLSSIVQSRQGASPGSISYEARLCFPCPSPGPNRTAKMTLRPRRVAVAAASNRDRSPSPAPSSRLDRRRLSHVEAGCGPGKRPWC